MINIISLFSVLIMGCYLQAYTVTSTVTSSSPDEQEIKISFNLEPKEFLYKDSLQFSVNNPQVIISQIIPLEQPSLFFDEQSKSKKESYKNQANILVTIKKKAQDPINNVLLHSHFSINTIKQPQQKIIPLQFYSSGSKLIQPLQQQVSQASKVTQEVNKQDNLLQEQKKACAPLEPSLVGNILQKTIDSITKKIQSLKTSLFASFTGAHSGALRMLVALVLGILLSLTPCIYPMIPITVGILQANQSSSVARSFLLSLSYTLGISTTFAILGLIAVFSSCVFGELQGSIWVVIPVVAILFYLGFSMLGLYEMYIPRFLQPKNTKVQGGSFISAYIFGAVSGGIASPCASPGLTLILSFVNSLSKTASWLQYVEGFMLLFIFGIGSSLPLLIIGTFSTSLNMLPKAGMWMIEVKKLLGLMLFGMGFYYLSHLERFIPWYILVWFITVFIFTIGIYYFMQVQTYDSPTIKRFKKLIGALLIIISCIVAVQGYKALYDNFYAQPIMFDWIHDYNRALERAQREHKRLFIDIGATYCGACKSIDATVFKNKQVLQALENYVPVKIESNVHEQAYEEIKKQFGQYLKGFPTFLVVNPVDQKVIQSWSVEWGDLSIDDIVNILDHYKAVEIKQ